MPLAFTHDDRIATIAACTTLGRSVSQSNEPGPLTPSEWNKLAQWLHDHGRQPSALLDRFAVEDMTAEATLDPVVLAKIAALPDKAPITALELERLEHRGIWALARLEDAYPKRWKQQLKTQAPPVIFGAGSSRLLNEASIAIVGSRDISEQLMEVADLLGRAVAKSGFVMVSGGARGSDLKGMMGAIERGGKVVGILSGALDRLSRSSDTATWLAEEQLCLISHVHPSAGFSVGNAMARNKLIHGLAEATIVISTSYRSGGTWAGSIDNLKYGWTPLLIWNGAGAPEANDALIKEGGYPFDAIPEGAEAFEALIAAAQDHAATRAGPGEQPSQQQLL
jgi:predicted Rossmann fold nucleotide-binding protein DprA/Smf involved in DNA uptake